MRGTDRRWPAHRVIDALQLAAMDILCTDKTGTLTLNQVLIGPTVVERHAACPLTAANPLRPTP